MWPEGLLVKLKAVGISDNLLKWFKDYLNDRKQHVVPPGAASDWSHTKAGVPQGSVLGPLLFFVYINDIVIDINSNIRLFADDTCLFIAADNPAVTANLLNSDLLKISNWADKWLVKFNPAKTRSLVISCKATFVNHPSVLMYDQIITEVDGHKHLGVILSNNLSWHKHIEYILA